MADYTTQVRTICESSLGMTEPAGFNEVNDIIRRSAPLVFNFDFPIWDETYRLTLECKILKHYYMREIGAETVGLWKLWLDEKLNIIMPYYNELYKTTVLKFNPLYDVDLQTEHTGKGSRQGANSTNETRKNAMDGTRNGSNVKQDEDLRKNSGSTSTKGEVEGSHSGSNTSKYSDTPQGSITDLEKDKYLTNATIEGDSFQDNTKNRSDEIRHSDDKENRTSHNHYAEQNGENSEGQLARIGQENVKTTDDYVQHVFGANGNRTYASKILELRKAIINIDAMIIEELNELFFGLWG